MIKNCREWQPRHSIKKIMALLLSIAMLLSITAGLDFSANALASSGKCGDNVTYTFNSSTGTLTINGSGPISDWWCLYPNCNSPFYDDSYIKHIIIEEGITRIGENTFMSCSNLSSVSISSSVSSIGSYAFAYCGSLTKVNICDLAAWCSIDFEGTYSNPLVYASKLYLNNRILTDLTLPSGFSEIKDYAFYGCTSLRFLNFSNSITRIGESSFCGCSSLESISLSGSVKEIGYKAFCNCKLLKTITIPYGIERIGSYAFYGCESVQSIKLSNSVNSIGDMAFNCIKLKRVDIDSIQSWCNIDFDSPNANPLYNDTDKKITLYYLNNPIEYLIIPNNVEEIKAYAFYNYSSLRAVTIPTSVKKVGESAFYWCKNLNWVDFGYGIEEIEDSAFLYDPIIKVFFDGTKEQWHKVYIGYNNSSIIDVNTEYNSHYYSEIITKKATCKERGIITYTCNICGNSYSESIPLASHTPVTDKAVPATFKAAGKTEGKHCKVCGKVLVAQKTIAKLGSPSLSKVTAGSKQFKATWKSIKNIDGYQIQYSTSSSFKSGNKTVTVSGYKSTSKTVKSLKAKKKYYVRIRAYKTINGKKQYSAWSAKKTVTTKK